MINKNKKTSWREKIVYYEICPKGKVSSAFARVYRVFVCSACILAGLLFVIYLYLFFYAHNVLKDSQLYKQTNLAAEWKMDENMWQALIVDKNVDDHVLYLQPSGLNAILEVRYDDNSKISCLEYQPALVDDGNVVHASRVYTVMGNSDHLDKNVVIFLKELQDLESGLYAPEILVGNYDELVIPDLGY